MGHKRVIIILEKNRAFRRNPKEIKALIQLHTLELEEF
jgi:hypothetical protein